MQGLWQGPFSLFFCSFCFLLEHFRFTFLHPYDSLSTSKCDFLLLLNYVSFPATVRRIIKASTFRMFSVVSPGSGPKANANLRYVTLTHLVYLNPASSWAVPFSAAPPVPKDEKTKKAGYPFSDSLHTPCAYIYQPKSAAEQASCRCNKKLLLVCLPFRNDVSFCPREIFTSKR